MPVFGENEETTPVEPTPPPTPEPDVTSPIVVDEKTPLVPEQGNYDSVILDDNYHDLRLFFQRMEGMTFTVQFYHQLLGGADLPEIFDPELSEHHHQLRRIKNLQIKLQGDISFSKDPNQDVTEITGDANFYPGFTPNKYDTFIGDAGEGRKYLFHLTEVVELSARRDRVVNAKFKVIKVLEPKDVTALDACVVDAQLFTKEFVSEDGFLSESKAPALHELATVVKSSWLLYYDLFYAHDQNTFLYDYAEVGRLYDPFLAQFIRSVVPDNYPISDRPVEILDCGQKDESISTIWDMLLDSNKTRLHVLNKEMRQHSRVSIPPNFDRDSVWFSNVDYFCFPVDENNTLLSEYRPTRRELIAKRSPRLELPPETLPTDASASEYLSKGDYKSPSLDYYYVLSGAFYQGQEDHYSKLETLVARYLDRYQFEPADLLAEFKYVLESDDYYVKFYHLPVLLVLAKTIFSF